MRIVHDVAELRDILAPHPRRALVATMGNLHDGHIALVDRARAFGGLTVASIFVNRLQFLPHEDFDSYPRTWEADCARLREAGCDVLFAPRESDLYPQPQTYKVQPDPALADVLEGTFRPGFFTGVCTVVAKLLHCVQPTQALFGRKDYQQLRVIEGMVRQLAMPVEVVACDTLRAPDGLALSSRNGYLSAAERGEAVQLSRTLRGMADALRVTGGAHHRRIEADAMAALAVRGWQPDYLAIRRRADLQPATPDDAAGALVVLGAARLGTTRLIDNLEA